MAAQGWSWFIATPGPARWEWVGLSMGGVLGIGIAQLFLKIGWISRSFADYAEWEAKAKAEAAAHSPAVEARPPLALEIAPSPPSEITVPPESAPTMLETPTSEAAPAASLPASPPPESPAPTTPDSTPEMWMAYPYARREMVLELIFLAPCLFLMLVGWYAGRYWGGVSWIQWTNTYTSTFSVPPWLQVLSGVFMGYLIGGGLVWLVRIAGSLAFGKEAMGMGDVHLMAGVGAALGWTHSTLAFFGAAFVGLAWAILGRIAGGRFQRMLPYGPFLAVSTVLVVLCKPLIERGLTALTKTPIHLPP
jgi:hypothetical protein